MHGKIKNLSFATYIWQRRIRNGTSRDFYLKAAKAAKAAKAKTDGARGAWVLLDAAKPVQVDGNAVGMRWDAVGCSLGLWEIGGCVLTYSDGV